MWYQVIKSSVQNKVIALIVQILQFDILIVSDLGPSLLKVWSDPLNLWGTSPNLSDHPENHSKIFPGHSKKSLCSKTWLWSCFNKWNFNPDERNCVQEWGAEGLVWVPAVHARGDPLLSSWRGLGQVRDSIGISKLPQIQLTLPFKSWFYLIISAISASSEIPLLSLDQVSTWGHWEVSHHRWRVHLHLRRLPQSQQLSQWRLAR